jgi:metal-responsive CopG/Arc/MetJ family transcriptional regulator
MANPSISVDDDVLMEFDDIIWQLKKQGEMDRGVSRSQVIQQLMEEWIREKQGPVSGGSGNRIVAPTVNSP